MRALLIAFAIALQAGPALATGGISCEGESGATSFSLSAAVSHVVGTPLFGLGGDLATGFEDISPDMRDVSFSMSNLAQWWQDGEELNLLLIVERREGPGAHTQLTIKTRATEEGLYEGTFMVDSFERIEGASENLTRKAGGAARCMAE